MKEHNDLRSGDLLASRQDQLHHLIEVGLAGGQMPGVDVVGLEAGEEEFARRNIIAISDKKKMSKSYVSKLKIKSSLPRQRT